MIEAALNLECIPNMQLGMAHLLIMSPHACLHENAHTFLLHVWTYCYYALCTCWLQATCQLVDQAFSNHIAPVCAAVGTALQQPALVAMLDAVRKAQNSIGSKIMQQEFSTLDEDAHALAIRDCQAIADGTSHADAAAHQRIAQNMAW